MRLLQVILCISLLSGAAHAGDEGDDGGRFFLFVTPDPPLGSLVETAHGDAQKWVKTVAPAISRARLGAAYPRLFDAGRAADVRALDNDMKSGTAAHYNASFAAAEGHFARALEFAFSEPDALATHADILGRLADMAALRYKNALAMQGAEDKAAAELERFVRRFSALNITTSDHPPNVVAAWDAAHKLVREKSGSLSLSVHPVEFERSGDCQLFVNGVRYANLPLAGPVRLPQADHQIQVRCGNRVSWLQNVSISDKGISVIIPVRAMLGARGDFATGGLVLVAPAEGDASSLVTAVSQAAGFQGAAVMRAAIGKVELGRQDMGTAGPSREAIGRLDGDNISNLRKASVQGASGGGVGPWQWVTGGVGAAALIGGAVANVLYVSDYDAGRRENLDSLATMSVVGYIAGGALLATSVVLFIVDASSDGKASADSGVHVGRGGLFAVSF